MVKCLVCSEFEEEAKRYAGNNRVYLAGGVFCDGKEKLQDIVTHLHGASHAAALERKKLSTQWSNNSMNNIITLGCGHWFTSRHHGLIIT